MPVLFCFLSLALAVTPESQTAESIASCDSHGACSQHSSLLGIVIDDHNDGLPLSLLQRQASRVVSQPGPGPSLQHPPSSGSHVLLHRAEKEPVAERAGQRSNSTRDIRHGLVLISGTEASHAMTQWEPWLSYRVWAGVVVALAYSCLLAWSLWLKQSEQTPIGQCKWAVACHLNFLNVVSFNLAYLLPGVQLAAQARLQINVLDYNILLGVSLVCAAPISLVCVNAARYIGWLQLNQMVSFSLVVVATWQLAAIMFGSFGMMIVSSVLIQCCCIWSLIFSQTFCAWVFLGESMISTAFALVCLGVEGGIAFAMTIAPVMLEHGSLELVFIQGIVMAIAGVVSALLIAQLMSKLPEEISDRAKPRDQLPDQQHKVGDQKDKVGDKNDKSVDSQSGQPEWQEVLASVPVLVALVCLGYGHIFCQRLNLGGMLMVADDIGISRADAIASVPVLMLVLCSIPVGLLVDKIGQRPLMLLLGCAGMSVCSLLIMSLAAPARRTGMFGYGIAWALFQTSLWVMFPKILRPGLVDIAMGIVTFMEFAASALCAVFVGISVRSCGGGVTGAHCGDYAISSIAALATVIAAGWWVHDKLVGGSSLSQP